MFTRRIGSVKAFFYLLGVGALLCGFASPPASAQSFTFSTLYSCFDQDGANPYTTPIQGTDGNFYGTTANGGAYGSNVGGYGTVFKMTPTGAVSILYSFQGAPTDGSLPFYSLVQGKDGCLYGVTATPLPLKLGNMAGRHHRQGQTHLPRLGRGVGNLGNANGLRQLHGGHVQRLADRDAALKALDQKDTDQQQGGSREPP
ncbi:MAG TPA: choice-of-anchor tandem repeat GloVer-containing protein [Chthonomonadaceae bacterium]|nr:choice-of-anchor tandem repeat GloVer-containing protein [Chthonomonadaceae bacterium]